MAATRRTKMTPHQISEGLRLLGFDEVNKPSMPNIPAIPPATSPSPASTIIRLSNNTGSVEPRSDR